jgi:hypothetical protein
LYLAYLLITRAVLAPSPLILKKRGEKMININQEKIYDQLNPQIISTLFYEQVRRMSAVVTK